MKLTGLMPVKLGKYSNTAIYIILKQTKKDKMDTQYWNDKHTTMSTGPKLMVIVRKI